MDDVLYIVFINLISFACMDIYMYHEYGIQLWNYVYILFILDCP
jgi:hypothetical protein